MVQCEVACVLLQEIMKDCTVIVLFYSNELAEVAVNRMLTLNYY